MHGVTLISGPSDWEIIQQKDGYGKVTLVGKFNMHPDALAIGVEYAVPMARVMRESDNAAVISWVQAGTIEYGEDFSGTFEITLNIPAGGLYRIETCLETKSAMPDLAWLFRGDCILHVGVGNLFLIAGQSNAAGYSRDFCTDPPHMCVHMYRNRSRWDMACHPLNESTMAGSPPNEERGIPGPSPYLSFAKVYYELTGMPVGLIPTALGGSPISSWHPETGDLYRNMMRVIRETGGSYSGILWYQGCSDTQKESAALYFERFWALVEAVRKELGYEIPFFTMQLNRHIGGLDDEGWGIVRDAQRRAALEIQGVHVLSTTNLSLSDAIHNSAGANVILGEKLAGQCAGVLNGREEFEAPGVIGIAAVGEKEKEAIGVAGSWMKIDFSHVKNCFLVSSPLGSESGFTLEDENGFIEIKTCRNHREDKNRVYLELERDYGEEAYLSFAWQADPVRQPLVDEVTFLPPLSFYRMRV